MLISYSALFWRVGERGEKVTVQVSTYEEKEIQILNEAKKKYK